MAPLAALLSEYGESHQNPANKLVHWVCVPVIMFSLLGSLWAVPVPMAIGRISPWLNWAIAQHQGIAQPVSGGFQEIQEVGRHAFGAKVKR